MPIDCNCSLSVFSTSTAEAMAAAGTASLGNVVMHVDWNQASIDSNRVCRDGDEAGD